METVVKNDEIKKWNDKPIYGIGLSDGQGGESFQMIPIGTPLSELIITPNPPYGNKIKWNKPGSGNSFGGGGRQQRGGSESFALAYSRDLVVAGKVDLAKIFDMADKMYSWLEAKKDGGKSNPVVLASQLPPKTDASNLPF
jgi:hypothetical protein